MKSALGFLALVALSQARVPMPRIPAERIINGEEAKVGEFPHIVSFQTKFGSNICSGSIISKNYVLTAAHCLHLRTKNRTQIVAGTTDLTKPQSIHKIDDYIVHEEFHMHSSTQNDIALIRVKEAFEFSKTISIMPLVEEGSKVVVGSVGEVAGWGTELEGLPFFPDALQRTNIEVVDLNYCRQVYASLGRPIYKTQLCAHNRKAITGTCHGDSGGPLMVDGTIVGIVSWSVGCSSTRNPTVFTRVSEYIDWINSHAV